MMRQKSPARVATLSFVGLAAAIAASTAAKADDVKMGYINKMGEHPWFVSEVAGAKAEAGKLGVNLMTQDVQFDANLALTTFDTMVGDGVKAIAIVVPDKALGPVVAEKGAEGRHPADRRRRRHLHQRQKNGAVCWNERRDHRPPGGRRAGQALQSPGLGQILGRQNRQHRGSEGRHLHAP